MELSVCLEELMDTPTFKRFNTALDGVLEAAEDMDLASIRGYLFTYYIQIPMERLPKRIPDWQHSLLLQEKLLLLLRCWSMKGDRMCREEMNRE